MKDAITLSCIQEKRESQLLLLQQSKIEDKREISNPFKPLQISITLYQKRKGNYVTLEKLSKDIIACQAQHNYLRQTENAFYTPSGLIDFEDDCGTIIPETWRSGINGSRLGRILQNLRQPEAPDITWMLLHWAIT